VHAHAEGEEVTVNQRVVIAPEEIGVGQAGGVGVLVDGIQTNADSLGTFVEQAVGAVAIDVVGEGDIGCQVYTGEYTVVVSQCAQAVTPGVGSGEAMIAIASH